MNFKKVILPDANSEEVSVISGIDIYPINHLQQFISYGRGEGQLTKLKPIQFSPPDQNEFSLDFADIIDQKEAKRALEIAAAGGHNFLMVGPPGAGKSMLAQSMVSILPPLTEKEALEVTTIYSVCGLTKSLIKIRPFRSPHHTTSAVGMIGGGNNIKPGEISLSHRGILFLDEFPEFNRQLIEALRQPMEDGNVTIARANGSARYPALFTLIAAANPCPCGYYGSLLKACICNNLMIEKYQKRLSGPILDRIDMRLRVKEVEIQKLNSSQDLIQETSQEVRQRVIRAREFQQKRFHDTPFITNSELTSKEVKYFCPMTDQARELLFSAAKKLNFSARSYFKIIKVSQTIADLEQHEIIDESHLAEALQYRQT